MSGGGNDLANDDAVVVTLQKKTRLFLEFYPLLLVIPVIYCFFVDEATYAPEFGVAGLVVVALVQLLTTLACQWSVNIKSFFRYDRASLQDATHAKVVPHEQRGKGSICVVERSPNPNWPPSFVFQKTRYFHDSVDGRSQWTTRDFPVNLTFGEYQSCRGYASDEEIAEAERKWEKNEFDIPSPTFWQLYAEHAVAPFFVFQILCVCLWLLDDYWQYSIFTLVMLLILEGTVVQSRLRNLGEIRKMKRPAQNVYVHRGGKWFQIMSDLLVPGDIISIGRSEEGQACPCDLLLLEGTCIVNEAMLTGESVPQMKEPVSTRAPHEVLSMKSDKLHVIFGGTSIVQDTAPAKSAHFKSPPNNALICYVLRTGFHTSQGSLVRTILFSTERVTANNAESLWFIAFLLVFALVAASYVWVEGNLRAVATRGKLLLECALIVTSVVPPELPIELSLAVNTSLMALTRLGVYCTEPFRIPSAGKVDVCCFDKTGTLTTEDLVVLEVAGLDGVEGADLLSLPPTTQVVMGGCHALVSVDGDVVGDPMEKAAVEAIHWDHTKSGTEARHGQKLHVRTLQRFHFKSELKRMGVVAVVTQANRVSTMALVKGAPEVLQQLFVAVPDGYEAAYTAHARRGQRVLALGYRDLALSEPEAKKLSREDVERDLVFAGLLVFHCPLKPTTPAAVAAIIASSHRPVMITGDAVLTACHVAQELGFTRKPTLYFAPPAEGARPAWVSVDESMAIHVPEAGYDRHHANDLISKFDLAVSGAGLPLLVRTRGWERVLPYVKVWARVSPEQKEYVLASFKRLGYTTLMCGDGTNDVGALKQADIGVALLNSDEPKGRRAAAAAAAEEEEEDDSKNIQKAAASAARSRTAPKKRVKPSAVAPARRGGGAGGAAQRMAAMLEEPSTVQLGDASIASPFTSRHSSLSAICHIIRQGRCTLVTTLQMYKILALNCLVNAYSLSVLYLDGIKYGDGQMTVSGLLIAACFFFISRSKPRAALSAERPQSSIFSVYMFVSLMGQFAVHLTSLIFVVRVAKESIGLTLDQPVVKDLEADFAPNIVNSVVFLLSLTMQISTFMINYRGHPFMDRFFENRLLSGSLLSAFGLAVVLASGFVAPLNEAFEIVPWPSEEVRNTICGVMIADFGAAWLVEVVAKFLFSRARPRISVD